ncbi:hypothetical protein Tco_0642696 [Tanacetum coccineum]
MPPPSTRFFHSPAYVLIMVPPCQQDNGSRKGQLYNYRYKIKNKFSKAFGQKSLRILINDQLEAEVLIRSSNEAKTSYAVAENLSKLQLKKILIDKMENNKSIDRSL